MFKPYALLDQDATLEILLRIINEVFQIWQFPLLRRPLTRYSASAVPIKSAIVRLINQKNHQTEDVAQTDLGRFALFKLIIHGRKKLRENNALFYTSWKQKSNNNQTSYFTSVFSNNGHGSLNFSAPNLYGDRHSNVAEFRSAAFCMSRL